MITVTSRLVAAVLAVGFMALAGCKKDVASLAIERAGCPPVSVVASGRAMNFYEVHLRIGGKDPVLLMANIDMPGDELQDILSLQESPAGIDLLVSGSPYVTDVNLPISARCHIKTVRPSAPSVRATRHATG